MIRILWILCLYFFLFIPVSQITGQDLQLSFHQLTTDNGLSEATNAFIYKDSRGFVWMSSLDGLNRFDGLNVKVYKPRSGDPHSLDGNIITSSFFEDKDANLWFTTYNAIHRYNREKDHFDIFRLKNDAGQEISEDYYAFHLDQKNHLWVRTGIGESGRLHWFEIDLHSDSILGPLDGQRAAVIPSSKGNIQVISTFFPRKYGFEITSFGKEIHKLVDGRPGLSKHALPGQSRHAYPESDTLVWIAMSQELLAFNPVTQTGRSYTRFQGNAFHGLSSVIPYGEDKLLVGNLFQGIFIFDKKQRQFIQLIAPSRSNAQSLPFFRVNDLYLDHHENLWVSSWGSGIAYANLKKHKFPILLEGASVSVIYPTSDGKKWCGTSEGVFVFNEQGKQEKYLPYWETMNGQRNDTIIEFMFHDQEGQLWATSGKKLLKWNASKDIFQQVQNFESFPYEVFVKADGQILMANYQGLFSLEKENGGLRVVPFILIGDKQTHLFTKIFEDKGGRLFLAENRNNLFILQPQNDAYELMHSFQDMGDIYAFFHEPEKKLIWIAGSRGLFQFNGKSDSLKQMGPNEGIPNEGFVQVLGYEDQLWLSGKSGLIQYFPEKQSYQTYNTTDGLLETTANLNAAYQSENGNIWLGSLRGINLISPTNIPNVPYPPDIQLTRLLVNDQEWKDSVQIGEKTSLEFPYTENTVSFEFVAMEYSEADKNQFAYRLRGYEEEWVYITPGEKGFVRYPNLPPQNYTLEIKAANSDGVWTENPRQLSITIHPPFWQRWWFRGLMLIIIAAIIWGLYRTQLNRQLAQAEAKRLR
ncbi:MAG: hypothetical protein KDD99_08860, partial [Bacteroidetes bacterium]|nr:hypothetical protein [Bacteroidota bacterium]